MRVLTVLSVLQTLGILVLVGHSFRDTSRVTEASSPARRVDRVVTLSGTHVEEATEAAVEQRLLRSIREELARLQDQLHTQDVVASPAVAERPRNESTSREERDAVAQRIENYRAMGSISEVQMLELQAAIVRLDAGSRKQLMSRLIRAWKSGEINGRL